MTDQLYDKAGAAFVLDHEHDGTAYVRPMVKVIVQTNYGDDFDEDEDYEPAEYLIAMNRADLFDAPPVVSINADIAAKKAELSKLEAEGKRTVREAESKQSAAERKLRDAERQLDNWMETHRAMINLGKLLDGEVLYPLSVKENSYHRGPSIPRIPTMDNAKYLAVHSGDFEKGQKWVCKKYGQDSYGRPFQFFNTEEERTAAIRAEFDVACQRFRKSPKFETTSHTTGTTLHYGTLMEWVKTHPALAIPDDIEAMKRDSDAAEIAARKAKLAAELAEMESQS